jgi:RNAse (barnase) inhibitor barstar
VVFRLPASLDDLPSNALSQLGPLEIDVVRDWAAAAGHRFIYADLRGCSDKKSVLREIGRAFELPDWFGVNLDALYDCLTDLPDVPDKGGADGYVVVLEHLPYTKEFGVDDRDALLDVFRDAAEMFADRGVALRVLYS